MNAYVKDEYKIPVKSWCPEIEGNQKLHGALLDTRKVVK